MASNNSINGEAGDKMRVFFIPFFATSHIFSMVELSCLFAACRHVDSTLVLTPANADIVKRTLDRSEAAGVHVSVLTFPFPDVGLPPGVENHATIPSSDTWRLYKAVELCRDVHGDLLRRHRPDVIVADIPYWWTTALAAELGIPRVTYHCVGTFAQLAINGLITIREQVKEEADENHRFAIPGLPGPTIEIPRSEMPHFMRNDGHFSESWQSMKSAQLASHGVVVNTFQELEPAYCDLYRRVDAQKAWFVGPLALATKNRHSDNNNECLRWLDKQQKSSVLYVCFGSWCYFSSEQLHEIAAGLESSGRPFLWVLRDKEAILPPGWEARVAGRGMVTKEFAPQVAILDHPAVGAFLTHCGWSSVMETVAAGVPVLTWPLVFDQYLNESLMVEVLGIGRRVWSGPRREEEGARPVVPREAIGRAVREFFGDGREAAAQRAGELAAAARAAVGEGGSSKRDLNCLVDELLTIWRKGRMWEHLFEFEFSCNFYYNILYMLQSIRTCLSYIYVSSGTGANKLEGQLLIVVDFKVYEYV